MNEKGVYRASKLLFLSPTTVHINSISNSSLYDCRKSPLSRHAQMAGHHLFGRQSTQDFHSQHVSFLRTEMLEALPKKQNGCTLLHHLWRLSHLNACSADKIWQEKRAGGPHPLSNKTFRLDLFSFLPEKEVRGLLFNGPLMGGKEESSLLTEEHLEGGRDAMTEF